MAVVAVAVLASGWLASCGPDCTDQRGRPVSCRRDCCRVCDTGTACGDTCISSQMTCAHKPGCACTRRR